MNSKFSIRNSGVYAMKALKRSQVEIHFWKSLHKFTDDIQCFGVGEITDGVSVENANVILIFVSSTSNSALSFQ